MRLPRALILGLIAASIAGSDASACRYRAGTDSPEYTYFFDEIPTHLKVGIVADVTVTDVGPHADQTHMVAAVRVNRVIAGSIDARTLNIAITPSSCGGLMRSGDRGIVAGDLRRDTYGVLELVAVPETLGAREKRKAEVQGKKL